MDTMKRRKTFHREYVSTGLESFQQRGVNKMWRSILLCTAVFVIGCGSYVPPAPPAPRAATPVSASFGKTWEAVVDVFAERNIPIKTIDRASGVIAAEQQSASTIAADTLADCGHNSNGRTFSDNLGKEFATWNVLVRGDSAHATVKATVRFSFLSPIAGSFECSSTGKWEAALEQRVKAAAEGKSGSQ